MIGTRLNHYEIVRKLGSGGMGDVYAATDGNLGREVALKILPPVMARDAERLERFRREATAVATLDHPNIVTIFSIEQAMAGGDSSSGGSDPVHFLTMQLVEGETLGDLIPRRGLDLERFFDIAVPLADAVAAAHDKGVTHRDLKPTNVMVTPEGRVKVLDFGLAKFADPQVTDLTDGEAAGVDGATQAATMAPGPITEEGKILGTAAYMSPEQAEGHAVDHRTDIFSLGIILYEMATGEAPFQGDSRISILSSVVRDEPPSVTDINRTAPRHLGRIIGHSLQKDPKKRFQSALDLRNELEGFRKEVESGEIEASGVGGTSTSAPGGGRRPVAGKQWTLGLAAVAMVAVIGGGWYWLGGDEGPSADAASTEASRAAGANATPVSAVDTRPSMAVLYFDNASGDEDLDWLRTGLPEMLVTDLSQSRGIRILTTDRVYGVLADAGVLDAGASEALDVAGEALGVDRVLLGSVMRAGDRIRIVARLQDVSSDEIIASESLEGDSEEDLFDLVDELTRRLRATYTGLASAAEVDRDLTDVTTSSVEALRLWIEADRFLNVAEVDEARERLLRAIEIDPDFAMAYAKLSAATGNIGDMDESRRYAEEALRRADHLTERERYYIEGTYYYSIYEEAERTEAAFRQLLDFDPSSIAARNNLALALQRLGRDDEAIAHFEVLVENNADFLGSWTNLAETYADKGRFDEAEAILQRLAERRPESGVPYDHLAELYLRQGRFNDTQNAVREALRRGWAIARRFEAGVGVLTRQWDLADSISAIGAQETEPAIRFGSIPFGRASVELYQGDSASALETLRTAREEVPEPGTFTSWLYEGEAYVHEARGDLGEAVRLVGLAVDDARVNRDRRWELAELGRLQAMDGQLAAAQATADRLDSLTRDWPEFLISREKARLAAAIASGEGNPTTAIEILEAEAEKLDPSGKDDPPHCLVWYDLAIAYIAAGDDGGAMPWLQHIVDSTTERTGFPMEYVRSLYLLAGIQAARGDEAAARANYELFLEHWGDGDLRRGDVETARVWLAAH